MECKDDRPDGPERPGHVIGTRGEGINEPGTVLRREVDRDIAGKWQKGGSPTIADIEKEGRCDGGRGDELHHDVDVEDEREILDKILFMESEENRDNPFDNS
jgi:hypothetical protein